MKLQEKLIEITSEFKHGGKEYLEMLHIMLDMAWESSTEFTDVYKKYNKQRSDKLIHQLSKERTYIQFPLKEHTIINKDGYCTIKYKDGGYFKSKISASKLDAFTIAVKKSNQESELANFLRDL